MITTFKKKTIYDAKTQDKFYNIFIMKKYLKFLVILLTILFFNKHAFSCDALNIKIGTEISQASEIFSFLENHEENYPEKDEPLRYDDPTSFHCPGTELDKTEIQIFVYNSKIAGIKLITNNSTEENKQIYNYTKNKYGNLGNEVTKKGWTGLKVLKYDIDVVLYSKMKNLFGVVEELYISTKEFAEHINYEGEIRTDSM